MALKYDMSKVENWEALESISSEAVITEAIIHGMMYLGVHDINKKNCADVTARFDVYQRLFGHMVSKDGAGYEIVHADIHRRIGLFVNVVAKSGKQVMRGMVNHAYENSLNLNKKRMVPAG